MLLFCSESNVHEPPKLMLKITYKPFVTVRWSKFGMMFIYFLSIPAHPSVFGYLIYSMSCMYIFVHQTLLVYRVILLDRDIDDATIMIGGGGPDYYTLINVFFCF